MHLGKRVTSFLLALIAAGSIVPSTAFAQQAAQAIPGDRWRRGSAVEPAAFGQIDAFTYQLRKEDLVRWDNPNIRVPLHIEWIQDWPQPIDKRQFAKINPAAQFDPDHVYVAFKPGTTPAVLGKALKSAGPVTWVSEMVPNLYQVSVRGKGVIAAVNMLLNRPEVLYAEPCYIDQTTATPNDPFFGGLWGLGSVNAGGIWADSAWDDRGGWFGDPNFVIAVIDTGVQINCVDLNANQWINPSPSPQAPYNGTDLYGWNVADNNGDVLPCGASHGTHVAGTIGAVGNNGTLSCGVNWQCKIMTLRCNGHGNCSGLYDTAIALDYAVTRGAKVSNNSYGHYGPQSNAGTAYQELIAAQAAGHIFVSSAGNDAQDNDGPNAHYPSGYNLSNIISVAAIQENATIASFSNWGWTTVDVGAPGVNIASTVPPCSMQTQEGTSMASPHVAGLVALVWGRYPQLEWWKVKQRVCEGTNNGYVACAFAAQINAVKALGYWVGPASFLQAGTYVFPFSPAGFANAIDSSANYGTVNLKAGVTALAPSTTITKPLFIRSDGPSLITR